MYKPPTGASPSWFVIPNRIKELSDAISRFTEHERICTDNEVTEIIKEWATEIIGHCNTIQTLNDIKAKENENDGT